MLEKNKTRKAFRELRKNINDIDKRKKEKIVNDKILSIIKQKTNHNILAYSALGGELKINLQKIIDISGKVFLPVVSGKEIKWYSISSLDELEKGSYNILEPSQKDKNSLKENENTIVIVPGIAFTEKGERLGQGGGYYDRAIPKLRAKLKGQTTTIGVCFSEQIAKTIPCEDFDITMDFIYTDTK